MLDCDGFLVIRDRNFSSRINRILVVDKCPTVELGVQDTHLRGKKKKM